MIDTQRPFNGATQPSPGTEDFVNLDILGILRRRYSVVLFCTVLGIGLAVLYCLKTTRLYESTTQILIMKKDANLPVGSGESSGGQKMNEDVLATHTQIILSPRIVSRSLDERNLRELPGIVEAISGSDQTAEAYVIDNLSVTRGGSGHASDAHVLNVAFVHQDENECFEILGAIIESYQAFVEEKYQDSSSEAVELISRAKDDLASDVRRQETEYRLFREKVPLIWQGEQVLNSHQIRLIEMEKSISENRLKHAQVKSRLEVVREVIAGGDEAEYSNLERMALIDEADIERLGLLVSVERGDPISEAFTASQPIRQGKASAEFDNMVELKLERQQLLLDVGVNHPRVRQLDESIRELNRFISEKTAGLEIGEDSDGVDVPQLMTAYVRLLKHDVAELERRRAELLALADAERLESKKLVHDELLGEALKRDLDRTQTLYDTVIDRLGEINLIKDYGGFDTAVIEPVAIGNDYWPNLPLLLALGTVMGLMFGCSAAAALDLIDRSFRSPEDISAALDLPVLTHVPNLRPASRRARGRLRRGDVTCDIDPDVVTYHLPRSREAEAFRGLRAAVFLSCVQSGKKVLLVSSPSPGDGKTTLTVNIAASIAQAGKRVLLIDADMRRPRVHGLVHVSNDVGLSSLLREECELADAIQDTDCEHLSVMPCGPEPENPSELLTGQTFKDLVVALREKFDFVVFDSPPVLAVSDPITIATEADACILQLRVVKNARPSAIKARDFIEQTGIEMLGVTVSGAEDNKDYTHGYYGYLGYGYNSYGNRNGEYFRNDTGTKPKEEPDNRRDSSKSSRETRTPE